MTPCCEFHERGGPRRAPCREVEHVCDPTVPVCTCGRRWEWQTEAGLTPRYTSDAVAQKYLALYGPLPERWRRVT